MERPYIGITGFMSADEVQAMLALMPASANRALMVGVLASLNTMRGIMPSKWPNRYPVREQISRIFQAHPLALNLIHYNTQESETLSEQLVEMTNVGGPNLHGFQLNLTWPSPEAIRDYTSNYPYMQIVLAVGHRALELMAWSPDRVADRVVREYDEIIDYVLIDPSGGYGRPFEPERLGEFLLALQEKRVNAGLGVAGGLNQATLDLIQPLIQIFPDLNWDAEGRLRDPVSDQFNLQFAVEYLQKSLSMGGTT